MTDTKNPKYCCLDKWNFYEMCSHCYNAYFTDPGFEQALYENWHQEPRVSSSNVCECGSEKAGGTTHSHWCPKGEK